MKKSILAVAVAAILISCGPKPAAVSLFNGKDLNGWTAVLEDSTLHPSTEFTVEDGAISLSGKFGYIRTEIPYADYRLNAEWRWPDSATNSGISPESREVMEEQSEPYGSPVQLAQHDFCLSFFKKGFAERLLGRIHFALELFVAGHFHDESVNRGRVFRPGRADVQFVHR